MLNAVSLFFKANGYRLVALAAVLVVGYVGWINVDLQLTKSALKASRTEYRAAQQTIAAQSRAIDALDRVDELDRRLTQELRNATNRIMQAQGANNEIPPDVAAAWAAGDDGLRAQRNSDPGSLEELRNP